MKNKYRIITRDWKGKYEFDKEIGMILVGGEDIETGRDSFCLIFSEKKTKRSAQEIYNIHNRLNSEDVEGFIWDKKDENIVIEL